MTNFLGPLRLLGLGWLFVVAIGIGLLAGAWLDSHLHTTPLFIIVGVTVGVVSGFVAFYRLLAQSVRDLGLTNARPDRHPDRNQQREGTKE